MSAVSVRNLDDRAKARIWVRVACHGRSMEAEMRAILTEAVTEPGEETGLFSYAPGHGERVRRRGARDPAAGLASASGGRYGQVLAGIASSGMSGTTTQLVDNGGHWNRVSRVGRQRSWRCQCILRVAGTC
jgi:plasmid stability protein